MHIYEFSNCNPDLNDEEFAKLTTNAHGALMPARTGSQVNLSHTTPYTNAVKPPPTPP